MAKKQGNRIMAALVCGVMVLQFLFAIPVMGERFELVNESFENTSEGKVPVGFVYSKNNDVKTVSVRGRKWLSVNPSTDGITAFAEHSVSMPKNVGVSASLTFMQTELKTDGCEILQLKNGNKKVVSLETMTDGSISYKTDAGTYISIIDNYSIGTPYKITVQIDFVSGAAKIYVNDVTVNSQLPLISDVKMVDRLRMSAKYSPGFLIDDVCITSNQTATELEISGSGELGVPIEDSFSYVYSVVALDENGTKISPNITWTIQPQLTGVSIVQSGGETATVVVDNSAAAGSRFDVIASAGQGADTVRARISVMLRSAVLTEIEITGAAKITSERPELYKYPYTAIFKDQFGNVIEGEDCLWSLEANPGDTLPAGIQVDNNGIITVSGTMPKDRHIYIKAQSITDPQIYGRKKLTLLDWATYIGDEYRFTTLVEYMNRVIKKGTDPYGDTNLIADALSVHTMLPMEWIYPTDAMHIAPVATSNLAMQANLYRTMEGMSKLLDDDTYYNNMMTAYKYYLDNLVSPSGLFYWGGHAAVDLKTSEVTHASGNEYNHEMKNHSPYIEPFFRLDSKTAENMIVAAWSGHMKDWSKLLFNRHANTETATDTGPDNPWYSKLNSYNESNVGVLIDSNLPFRIAGNDLIFFALNLYKQKKDKESLTWATRLLERYYAVQDPNTHLGGYQFTTASGMSGVKPLPDNWGEKYYEPYTYTTYGDRAQNQFEQDLFDEGYITAEQRSGIREYRTMFNSKLQRLSPFTDLELAQELGIDTLKGQKILRETVINLGNYGKLAYVPELNKFYQMFADGTIITGFELKKTGYYGSKGSIIGYLSADPALLIAYVKTYAMSDGIDGLEEYREEIWRVIKGMAMGFGLGNIGDGEPGYNMSIDWNTAYSDPGAIIALLYLYQDTGIAEYLDLARIVADNMIQNNMLDGFFVSDTGVRYIPLSGMTNDYPYALCMLEAAVRGEWDSLPTYYPCEGYFEAYNIDEDNAAQTRGHMDTLLFSKQKQTVKVTDIIVPETEITMSAGEIRTLDVIIEPDDATNTSLIWECSDYTRVNINPDTKTLTAGLPGEAKITILSADLAARAVISVKVH